LIVGGFDAFSKRTRKTVFLERMDILSTFGNTLLNLDIGHNCRNLILAQGGQRQPQELVQTFLGRAPNNEAFFKEITGQR
jgi:thimet oligopeptidase